MKTLTNISLLVAALVLSTTFVGAQKTRPTAKPAAKAKQVIFAVLNDGKSLEPIAFIDKGQLVSTESSGVNDKVTTAFTKTYYKPNGKYNLIFGGAVAGTVTIKSSDPTAECSANFATVSTVSAKAKLKGKVMGLATNAAGSKIAKSYRRMPTAAERSEIENLVRAEYGKDNIQATTLRSHNLTAIDVDHDGKAELVGSYWTETSPTSRALLFFIADQNEFGKYSFGYTDFRDIKQEDVMSGDIKSLEEGVYNELLLDSFEYNGDNVNEIFTYIQSFEGAGFNAYRREDGKWVQAFEGSNYHCGY